MKNLVILSSLYPYGTGETFLHNEIDLAKKYFDKIIIVPTLEIKSKKSRNLPKNVFVDIESVQKLQDFRSASSISKLNLSITDKLFFKDLSSQPLSVLFNFSKMKRCFECFFNLVFMIIYSPTSSIFSLRYILITTCIILEFSSIHTINRTITPSKI